ncbi:hypothetical protein SO802_021904 [Lithocarpus litseifolius]|uniref:Endonuclease/exonuclease/phosphatase domain-containing protein n=1 Tax=Lithocarpus litseifolius TaxID=425828 RepID=A0AAW2CI93_9ROSI
MMETQIREERAREITDRLPFDGAIHTADTIGYAGRLWVLWDLDKVDISPLAKIEQEVHIEVKVRVFNSSWLFTAVYASPRSAERQILWNNLMKVAELQNMPWVIVGDVNEPIMEDGKFGGRAVSATVGHHIAQQCQAQATSHPVTPKPRPPLATVSPGVDCEISSAILQLVLSEISILGLQYVVICRGGCFGFCHDFAGSDFAGFCHGNSSAGVVGFWSIMKETAQGESNRTDGGVVFQAAGCGCALIDASPELRQETQGIVDVPRDLSSSISSDFVQMFSLLQSIFKILLCIYKKILLFLPLSIRSKLERTVVGVLLLAFFLGFKEILENALLKP